MSDQVICSALSVMKLLLKENYEFQTEYSDESLAFIYTDVCNDETAVNSYTFNKEFLRSV